MEVMMGVTVVKLCLPLAMSAKFGCHQVKLVQTTLGTKL
jgi:hypothetical protein